MPTYNTKQFTWVPEDKAYVAEASTLSAGSTCDLFGQVFQDSCDEGFFLYSEKLRKVLTFCVWVTKEEDGDLLYWDLVPTARTQWDVPESRGVRVRVFND